MAEVARAKRIGFVEPQRVDDLDRDELLYLIKSRLSFVVTHRDLLWARWEALSQRSITASEETRRLCEVWEALDRAPLPGSDRVPLGLRKGLRHQEREKAWQAYRKAARARDRICAAADAAYKALDATR